MQRKKAFGALLYETIMPKIYALVLSVIIGALFKYHTGMVLMKC